MIGSRMTGRGMTGVLFWTRAALRDLDRIGGQWAGTSWYAGLRAPQRLAELSETLARLPWLGVRGRVPGTLEVPLPRTPYVVVYRTADGRVEILRVLPLAGTDPQVS